MTHQPSTLVWFILVDSNGHPFKGTKVSSISLSSNVSIDHFQEAAHLANSSTLPDIKFSQLQVYKNRLAFDGKQESLGEHTCITGLGTLEKEALVVVVLISADASGLFGRKKRNAVFPTPEAFIREPLFAREATIYMQHPPICSVTFFQGDIAAATLFLQT